MGPGGSGPGGGRGWIGGGPGSTTSGGVPRTRRGGGGVEGAGAPGGASPTNPSIGTPFGPPAGKFTSGWTGGGGAAGGGGAGAAAGAGAGGGFEGGGEGGLSREKFDKMFQGTPLQGQYDNVVREAQKNNVPPEVFAGVIGFETGGGKSAMVRDKLNPTGMFRNEKYETYPTIEAGIADSAKSLGRHWATTKGDIDKLGDKWAPVGATNDPNKTNAQWPSGVRDYSARLGGGRSSPVTNIASLSVRPDEPGSLAGFLDPQRTKLAISGVDTAGVPSAILENAKQVALTGGMPAVDKYMRDQGYPRDGNWCGQFAAAIVKGAGGTPPEKPEVASNWRNWGTSTDQPQPGDVAVRKGTSTGSTGSHVTFVESVDPKSGSFKGLGGNQGGGRISPFALDAYGFRRGSKPLPIQLAKVRPSTGEGAGSAIGPTGAFVKSDEDLDVASGKVGMHRDFMKRDEDLDVASGKFGKRSFPPVPYTGGGMGALGSARIDDAAADRKALDSSMARNMAAQVMMGKANIDIDVGGAKKSTEPSEPAGLFNQTRSKAAPAMPNTTGGETGDKTSGASEEE